MHPLVCIGGSVTQGMKSFAVLEPQLSYPAIIAHEMGLSNDEFRFPHFTGKGSFPLNIEYLLRKMDQTFGENVNLLELPFAGILLREWMDEIEDYWERGPGTAPLNYEGYFHNLAVWGLRSKIPTKSQRNYANRSFHKPNPLIIGSPKFPNMRCCRSLGGS